MPGLLDTALSGLRVSQNALRTSGHNIANANTDGYSRQHVEVQTNIPSTSGVGFIGNGASVTSVQRTVNEFVVEQLRIDSSLAGDLSAFNENIRQLDTLLSDPSTGLSSSLDSFFASLQNGADDPTSIPARQLIISEAENLATRFHNLYDRFETLNEGVNQKLEASIAQVNALASSIAELNSSITATVGFSDNPPNDLLDKRDEAIRQLSELVSIQVVDQGEGAVNVSIGSGQSLVVGNIARELALVDGEEDASQKDIAYNDGIGSQVITSFMSGGEIGGLLSFRDTALNNAYNELGRVALVMADTFNEAHRQGLDLNSEFGGRFFNDINDPSLAQARVFGSSTNAAPSDRLMSLEIRDSSLLTSSDYELNISSGNVFRVTRLSDGAEVAAGAVPGVLPFSVEFEGLELNFVSGSFQPGDKFLVQPTRTGARDFGVDIFRPETIAFASPLSTEGSLGNIGTGSISPGELLSLEDVDGNPLPLFATPGQMSPPLIVQFTSPTTYDILDNTDPGNPVQLTPPLRNQQYISGVTNHLFATDPGETRVVSNNDPATALGLASAGALANGYPPETISFSTYDPATGSTSTQPISTLADASARDIASTLSAVPGVSANARNYVDISGLTGLTPASSIDITLNGTTFTAGPGSVADMTSEAEIYDYLAAQINLDASFQAQGLHAVSGTDSSGNRELRIFSSHGDDLAVGLTTAGGETLTLADELGAVSAPLTNGNTLVVGGYIDVTLADNVTMATSLGASGLFGDSNAPGFARSSYLGIQASISGIPQPGDSFTLNFNQDGVTDNRNGLLIGDLSAGKLVDGGRSTYNESYAALVETIGIKTNASEINLQASEQVLQQTTDLRNSISGVNLDEEAAKLIQFEQIYNANTQVIAVARDLFDRLIGIL